MTTCYSETEMERLVLGILANQHVSKPAHIEDCKLCRSNFEDITDFYQDTGVVLSEFDTLTMEQLVDQKLCASEKKVYRFDALHRLSIRQSKPIYNNTLAADSEILTSPEYIHNVGVFCSTDDHLMVRILKGKEGEYSMFLLSDTPELFQHVMVKIIGFEGVYVSDKQGAIKLGKIDLPDSSKLGFEVLVSTETYHLKNYFPEADALPVGQNPLVKYSPDRNYKMELISIHGRINLKISNTESLLTERGEQIRVMLLTHATHAELKQFENGVVMFEDIQDPVDLQLKIFA